MNFQLSLPHPATERRGKSPKQEVRAKEAETASDGRGHEDDETLEQTGCGCASTLPDLLSCSWHQTVFTHPGEYPSKFSGRSSGSPSSFSGTFPHELHRAVAYCRSRQAYSSGGCAGMSIHVNRGTGFPFHLSPRPWGRAPETLGILYLVDCRRQETIDCGLPQAIAHAVKFIRWCAIWLGEEWSCLAQMIGDAIAIDTRSIGGAMALFIWCISLNQ
jgi:hypothetical protein